MATLEAPVRPRTSVHAGPFVTEPFFDFRNEENARRMRTAIAKVRGQLGREYDLIIGGKRVKTTDKIKSLNPSKPSEIVGIHQKAGKEHVEPAMKAALDPRSVTIATFALCGFANFSSIGIQIGGIGALAPNKRDQLAKLGFRAMIAGTMANLMSASIVGLLMRS